jgi:hypothetical protein
MLHLSSFHRFTFLLQIVMACLLYAGCGKSTPKETSIISALQDMQELATTEYTLTKVVKATDDQTWYKIGDRKILITCEAQVKAGIDFSAIDTRSVSKEGKSIRLQLPPPQIISVNLPPEKIQVAFQEIGFFRSTFTVAEQTDLLRQAEKQINEKAKSLGILEEAQRNARSWLTSYLSMIGFEEIDISFDAPLIMQKDKL